METAKESRMTIYPPLPRADSPTHPDADPESRLRAVSRWIAVASAMVALLTQLVQLLSMAWRELPWP
jgi:hypothetical protein